MNWARGMATVIIASVPVVFKNPAAGKFSPACGREISGPAHPKKDFLNDVKVDGGWAILINTAPKTTVTML